MQLKCEQRNLRCQRLFCVYLKNRYAPCKRITTFLILNEYNFNMFYLPFGPIEMMVDSPVSCIFPMFFSISILSCTKMNWNESKDENVTVKFAITLPFL